MANYEGIHDLMGPESSSGMSTSSDQEHNDDNMYLCEVCGKTFSQRRYLRAHAKIHIPKELLRCTMCGFECKEKRYLHNHMIVHDNIRPFQCVICKHTFKRWGHLRRHERCVHPRRRNFEFPIRKYKCRNSSCKKIFLDVVSILYHFQTEAHPSQEYFPERQSSSESNESSYDLTPVQEIVPQI